MKLKIATRASRLALAQAKAVRASLLALDPALTVELVEFTTRGDKILDRPLSAIGGKGLFTEELEAALRDGAVDLAVHSMKDFPVKAPEGLRIAAVPKREDARDVLITASGCALEALPEGCRLGTSSLRRAALTLALRPGVRILPLRGNVDTRLRKVREGDVDATLLAAAGLNRLGMCIEGAVALDPAVMIPAPGQGALCIETAADGCRIPDALLSGLHDADTAACVELERAALSALGGSCQVPVGVHAQWNAGALQARACIAGLDGRTLVRGEISGPADDARALGLALADDILHRGGKDILDALAHS